MARALPVVIAVTLACLAGACATRPVDPVLEDFRATFAADFDVTGNRFARGPGPTDEPYLLVDVRPKRAGTFVIRHDFRHGRRHMTREHVLMIGDRGAAPVVRREHYTDFAHPFACVGDTLVIAIPRLATLTDHRFFRESVDPRMVEIYARGDAELGEWKRPDAPPDPFPLDNGAGEHLELLERSAGSAVSRGGDFTLHDLTATFRARKPGQFNLTAESDVSGNRPLTWPVRIVEKDRAITQLATRVHTREFDDGVQSTSTLWHEPGPIDLRVGDVLVLHCGGYRTEGGWNVGPVKHPRVRILRGPFVPPANQFEPVER
jgi:hypothetical protein